MKLLIQYNQESTPADLFNICINKGGSSALAGYRLIYEAECQHPEITDDQLLMLGACVQLLDDIVDCTKDMREGIRTVVTYCLEKYRYLDYIAFLLNRIASELEGVFTKQKNWIFILLGFSIERSSYFSVKLRTSLGLSRRKRRRKRT